MATSAALCSETGLGLAAARLLCTAEACSHARCPVRSSPPRLSSPAVIFSIFEMRLLLSVWRARRGGVDSWTAQREISVLYLRFYAGLLGGILLTYQFQR